MIDEKIHFASITIFISHFHADDQDQLTKFLYACSVLMPSSFIVFFWERKKKEIGPSICYRLKKNLQIKSRIALVYATTNRLIDKYGRNVPCFFVVHHDLFFLSFLWWNLWLQVIGLIIFKKISTRTTVKVSRKREKKEKKKA